MVKERGQDHGSICFGFDPTNHRPKKNGAKGHAGVGPDCDQGIYEWLRLLVLNAEVLFFKRRKTRGFALRSATIRFGAKRTEIGQMNFSVSGETATLTP
jgi:hypothetical protein